VFLKEDEIWFEMVYYTLPIFANFSEIALQSSTVPQAPQIKKPAFLKRVWQLRV